jgi:hypothetical protein
MDGALVVGRAMFVQIVGEDQGQVHLCREDVRVEAAGKTTHLRALHDWGALSTLITHTAGRGAGLVPVQHPTMMGSGLGGEHTDTSHYYTVPVVSSEDNVQTVKAMGG